MPKCVAARNTASSHDPSPTVGERVKLEEKEDIIVGDIVVYILSDYEEKQHRPPASTSGVHSEMVPTESSCRG